MTLLDETQIKDVVRERYGALARESATATADDCCATDCCATDCCGPDGEADVVATFYDATSTDGLPAEALAASAGCGNPHAIGTLQPGETVVDFGSGGGIDCFIAAKAVGETGRVIGIDMTEDMIDLARSNASKLGLDYVEFHLAEMENTPLDDSSTDAIISNCVINLVPDKDLVFAEAFRILRPGGRLMVSDLVRVAEIPQEEAEDTDNWVSCLAGTEMKDVYFGRIRDAGFTDIEIVSDAPWKSQVDWRAGIHSMNIKAFKPAAN